MKEEGKKKTERGRSQFAKIGIGEKEYNNKMNYATLCKETTAKADKKNLDCGGGNLNDGETCGARKRESVEVAGTGERGGKKISKKIERKWRTKGFKGTKGRTSGRPAMRFPAG